MILRNAEVINTSCLVCNAECLLFHFSSESEADGASAHHCPGGPGDPPFSQDVSGSTRAASKVGEGEDGGHATG